MAGTLFRTWLAAAFLVIAGPALAKNWRTLIYRLGEGGTWVDIDSIRRDGDMAVFDEVWLADRVYPNDTTASAQRAYDCRTGYIYRVVNGQRMHGYEARSEDQRIYTEVVCRRAMGNGNAQGPASPGAAEAKSWVSEGNGYWINRFSLRRNGDVVYFEQTWQDQSIAGPPSNSNRGVVLAYDCRTRLLYGVQDGRLVAPGLSSQPDRVSDSTAAIYDNILCR